MFKDWKISGIAEAWKPASPLGEGRGLCPPRLTRIFKSQARKFRSQLRNLITLKFPGSFYGEISFEHRGPSPLRRVWDLLRAH